MLGGIGVIGIVVAMVGSGTVGMVGFGIVVAMGIVLNMWGGLAILGAAFQEGVAHGFAYIFVPFYALYYVLTRWETCGPYFLRCLLGSGMMVALAIVT